MPGGRYGCRREQARWASGPYICRTRAVQSAVGRPIKVRNAREMVLWWDAQVPDRLPVVPGAGGLTSKDGEAEDGQAAGVRAPDLGGA
ncbi:hypothetical protein OQI_17665 [Streptomyces pharetrae CZA14]|uniref:Uncharacterized protein n=1 Tax=Streptomyces pharetrae CZA14 TaxID=1144883 RepID=A0ABX3YI67_9ACTN|nr:hypothetical protein OQI_17665 [Streptomyces pharetrae CZA14]